MADEDVSQTDSTPPQIQTPVDPQVLASLMAGIGPNSPPQPPDTLQGKAAGIAAAQAAPPVQPPSMASIGAPSPQLPPALAEAISNVPQGAASYPMVKGGQTPEQAQGPPRPVIGGLPGLIMDLLNPGRNVAPGQMVPSKLDRFESFLGNFLQSLSSGFANEGHGPGAAMRGAAAAMQAPYQQGVQQWQMQQQQNQQQAQIALEQSRIRSMTPSIPVQDPRTGATLNIAPADMGKYLAAGYKLQGVEETNKSREKVAEEKIPPQIQALRDAQDAYKKGDMKTYNDKIKEAQQMSAALKPGMQSPFGKLSPEMAAVGMPPNYADTDKYPLGMKDPKFLQDVKTYGQQVTTLKQENAMQLARARGESYAYGRAKYLQMPVLNQATQTPEFRTPLEIAASGGSLIPLTEGDKLMMKNAIFEDISGASGNLRKAIKANKDGFSASQVAQLTAAMDGDPSGGLFRQTVGNLVRAGGKDSLSPTQRDVAIAIAQATENAYALRGVAGYGQGSDDLRKAIRTTLPSLTSPTEYAIKQLDAFDGQISRLRRGIPRVAIRPEGGTTPPSGGGAPNTNTNKEGYPIVHPGG